MAIDWISAEVSFALDFAGKAGPLAGVIERETKLGSLTKTDLSPVTVADFAVQALAGCLLRRAFPNDLLVGEESAAMLGEASNDHSLAEITHFLTPLLPEATPALACEWINHGTATPGDRFWTLDPIDGTKGFIRGHQYATALALVEKGRVSLAILTCPKLSVTPGEAVAVPSGEGSVLFAVRGEGAWTMPIGSRDMTRLRVSCTANPSEAVLVRSYEDSHTDTEQIHRLVEMLGIRARPVRMDSQTKYALIAAGVGDVLLRSSPPRNRYAPKIWDHAAGTLVVEEAGGTVSDLQGCELDFSVGRTLARNDGVLATNRELHAPVLDALRRIREATDHTELKQ